MNKIITAAGLLLFLGATLVPGIFGFVNLSVVGTPPLANAPVGFVLFAGQCYPTPGSSLPVAGGQLIACPTPAVYGSASASPGVMQGTTDANGNLNLIFGGASPGSGPGALYCNGGVVKGTGSYSPFYMVYYYLNGQWQTNGQTWMPLPTVITAGTCTNTSPASPYQFQINAFNMVTNSSQGMNVSIWCGAIGAPCSPPATTSTTSTSSTSSTTTSVSTTSTITQTITQTKTGTTTTKTTTTTTSVIGGGGSFPLNAGMVIGLAIAGVGVFIKRKGAP